MDFVDYTIEEPVSRLFFFLLFFIKFVKYNHNQL